MTQHSDSSRCRHATCKCTVEASLAYCCEYCARADQQETGAYRHHACECGHPECLQQPERSEPTSARQHIPEE